MLGEAEATILRRRTAQLRCFPRTRASLMMTGLDIEWTSPAEIVPPGLAIHRLSSSICGTFEIPSSMTADWVELSSPPYSSQIVARSCLTKMTLPVLQGAACPRNPRGSSGGRQDHESCRMSAGSRAQPGTKEKKKAPREAQSGRINRC